jgi:hypothetical protein
LYSSSSFFRLRLLRKLTIGSSTWVDSDQLTVGRACACAWSKGEYLLKGEGLALKPLDLGDEVTQQTHLFEVDEAVVEMVRVLIHEGDVLENETCRTHNELIQHWYQ